MISHIKYLAVYQIAPVSAITYVAEVASIEPWQDGKVKQLHNSRYASLDRLKNAKNLDEAF